VAGVAASNTNNSGSGAACKNILLTVGRGKRLSVTQNYDGGVVIGVLTPAGELAASTAFFTIWNIAVQLNPGTYTTPQQGGSAVVYFVNGATIATAAATTTVPNAVPFLGGTLVSGFGGSSAVSPVNPQIRASSALIERPSHLFGGPLAAALGAPVPGAYQFSSFSPLTIQPSYVLVEWME
jgi:hypothetical protein